jgi:alpha-1,3-glucosyltransferase
VEIGWALGGLPGTSNTVKPKPSNDPTVHNERKGSSGNQVDGIGREVGARAMSLGFARGRRRGSYRPASVGADVR